MKYLNIKRFIKTLLLVCVFSFCVSPIYSQNLNKEEKNTIVYEDPKLVQTADEPMVTKVMNADMYDYIFSILKDNLWFVILICIMVVFILYIIIGLLTTIIKGIGQKIDNSEYIEIGKFKIKNRKYKRNNANNVDSKTFNVDQFLSILELLLESEISNSISKTIDITNNIHLIDITFKNQCEIIFKNTFNTIKNIFYSELISYIINVTGFSNTDIHKTKEYFFINDFLSEAYNLWIDYTRDILSRNGFVEIVDDNRKANGYIEEINTLVWQAIDVKKMEVTAICKKDFDEIINNVVRQTRDSLELMFVRLGRLKQSMISKKEDKLKMINDDVKQSTYKLIYDIKNKFLMRNKNNEDQTQQQQPESIEQQQNNDTNND